MQHDQNTSTKGKGTRSDRGISLVEMLTVVAIIGVLSFVASGHYHNVIEKSRETVAKNLVEVLNQGVSRYVQIEGEALREVPASNESSDEEMDVLRALQWVDPVQPTPGSPYMRRDYDPAVSSDSESFRAVWNGAFFELRLPGQEGAGLEIVFDGSDTGRTVTYAEDYVPLAGY